MVALYDFVRQGFILKTKCLLSICEVQTKPCAWDTRETEKEKHTKQAGVAPTMAQLSSRRDKQKGERRLAEWGTSQPSIL